MSAAVATNPILARLYENRGMLFPMALITLLMVILIPLPTPVLDLLLTLNITLSVVVLVTTIYVKSPLELAVFPSLLLAITLFRLVLNVATTRLILTNIGGTAAAGEVVQTFADFVTRGSLAVGIIIFVIIVVIQFVVITKGAMRIGEVAARFTLDAMPGKQMAIDADLNGGHINEQQAASGARRSLRKRTSTEPWTVLPSSSAATPSPPLSSPSSTFSAEFMSAWSSTTWTSWNV